MSETTLIPLFDLEVAFEVEVAKFARVPARPESDCRDAFS